MMNTFKNLEQFRKYVANFPTLRLKTLRKSFGRPKTFIIIHDTGWDDYPLLVSTNLNDLANQLDRFAATKSGQLTLWGECDDD